ncbi:MAG: hypothetical protein DMF36_06135 [Verrucomicrobia bacterium]|nr:MAG: hypothetical protein AUH08_04125 [Verrucomicrobia bacterium 13_2_20CM_54_12]OLB44605.1 MAG: hypothetical protein AUI00_01260 [Verrucomicrobia bacterium 13_2_20CM_2_54_15]OLD73467.1 MAG: hypothetical protein AUF68_03500 [Verrucomicrobia bacterium 13_1_20CM_54_28]OLD87850.1 MAG: hypothetical protein AUG81_07985 [Verrucomicrobia bacterium 13_1_20CM_4_54_11]OLE12598.1 MAG: hypothetical protein AUG52_03310 [Verrucomicrobia bacterium 13_1_20CM_3_54_17]PYK16134.1 MAG: hypothetical protein DME
MATWRLALCELIRKINTTAIVNWPIDPLGPPIQPGDGTLAREHIAEAESRAGAWQGARTPVAGGWLPHHSCPAGARHRTICQAMEARLSDRPARGQDHSAPSGRATARAVQRE